MVWYGTPVMYVEYYLCSIEVRSVVLVLLCG